MRREIEWDEAKRQETIARRGLDFADAWRVLASGGVDVADDRRDYGEQRFISYGRLDGAAVTIVWTWRGASRRIISMRYSSERERRRYGQNLGSRDR